MTDKECSDFLHSSLFQEYQKRIEAHFEATDARIEAHERLRKRENEMLERAVNLQAAEYERRLTVLNHAHEAAVAEQGRVVPRETFSIFIKEYEGFKRDFDIFRLATSKELTTISTRSITWTSAIGVIFLIVTTILQIVMWRVR